jgi:dTDP-4-amino-4,6-dideoxygalactose transaminase
MPAPGLNYRLTDIQCALGLSQLKKLSMFKEHRQNIRDAYVKAASKYPDFVRMMPVTEGSDACWHLAVALIDFKGLGITRTTMMHDLKAMNIGTQVHYQPVHTQPYYKNIKDERLVGAETYFSQALTLPLHMMITEEQAEIVIETIVAYLKSHRQSHAA